MLASKVELSAAFERQLENLIQKQYPQMAKLSVEDFLAYLTPLKRAAEKLEVNSVDLDAGCIPFVVVVKDALVPTEQAMAQVERQGKQGITKLFPHTPADFIPLSTIPLPASPVYLLVDIDRGKESLNIPPKDAMKLIITKKRSPLTIDEGVALVTHLPDFLKKNNCFSLLASRHAGDKRVPAIWISGTLQPNLGWCWEGNPHTWLGSASCKERID